MDALISPDVSRLTLAGSIPGLAASWSAASATTGVRAATRW